MSDDSNEPKSVFDAETVIWSPEDRSKLSNTQTKSKIGLATEKTHVKITSFNDEATVIASVDSLGALEEKNDLPRWDKKLILISLSGLMVGLLLFYFLNQKTKNIETVEKPKPVVNENIKPKPLVAAVHVEPTRAPVVPAQKSSLNIKTYATPQDFLSGLARAISESQNLASRP